MIKKIFILIFLVWPCLIFAQDTSEVSTLKRNSIYFEVSGQGIYPSLNFDRLHHIDKKINTSYSAGLTLVPTSSLFILSTPISYNWLFGQKNSHLELGIGLTAMYLREGKIDASRGYTDQDGVYRYDRFVGHENNFFSYITPKIGYRLQKQNGGLFLRINLTPHIAGINRYGGIKGRTKGVETNANDSYNEYFSSVAFLGNRVLLRGGISLGWTLKK